MTYEKFDSKYWARTHPRVWLFRDEVKLDWFVKDHLIVEYDISRI